MFINSRKNHRELIQKIAKEAEEQFLEACEILLSAYVSESGAGQLGMSHCGIERKAWVIPIAATDEMVRKVEELKESDRFRQRINLYKKASPIPPHQAMVVQSLDGTQIKTAYRLRDDVKMKL